MGKAKREPIASINVCINCMLTREQGEIPEGAHVEPWSLLPYADVTPDFGGEDEEGVEEFSTADCEACRNTLAGTRYRYAVWNWDITTPQWRVTTNGHSRDLLSWSELTPEQCEHLNPSHYEEGDADPYEAQFFSYRGDVYALSDFERVESEINPPGMRTPFAFTVPMGHPLGQWAGIMTTSHGTAIVLRWGKDWDGAESSESVVVGYAVLS